MLSSALVMKARSTEADSLHEIQGLHRLNSPVVTKINTSDHILAEANTVRQSLFLSDQDKPESLDSSPRLDLRSSTDEPSGPQFVSFPSFAGEATSLDISNEEFNVPM